MVICNREDEILNAHSDNLFAYTMNQQYGLTFSYNEDWLYSQMYAQLAEVSLERKKDADYLEWAELYEAQIEILSYPTEDPSEIDYPV